MPDVTATVDDAVPRLVGLPAIGRRPDASHLRARFHKALEAAGVRRVRFHDLRHTFGTQMAAAGCPLRTLQGYMGHASYTTTEVYADFAPDPTRGAAWAETAFGSGSANALAATVLGPCARRPRGAE